MSVCMPVCVCVCLCVCAIESQGSKGGPRGAKQSPIVFEASHWPSDHMTRSRPLIGQPSFPTIWWNKTGFWLLHVIRQARPSATRPSYYTCGALKTRGGCRASIASVERFFVSRMRDFQGSTCVIRWTCGRWKHGRWTLCTHPLFLGLHACNTMDAWAGVLIFLLKLICAGVDKRLI